MPRWTYEFEATMKGKVTVEAKTEEDAWDMAEEIAEDSEQEIRQIVPWNRPECEVCIDPHPLRSERARLDGHSTEREG